MNHPQEVQTVIDLYKSQKHRLWSKVAKRITGFHFFGNNSFTSNWIKTFTKWLAEIEYVEGVHSPMVILGLKITREFIAELATALEERALLTPNESETIRSKGTVSVKPQNVHAQAIFIKLFFELSLMRLASMHYSGSRTIQIKMEALVNGPLDEQLIVYDDFGPITES